MPEISFATIHFNFLQTAVYTNTMINMCNIISWL